MKAPSLAQLLVSHWQPQWGPTLQAVALGALYVWCARRRRGRWPPWRVVSFLAGIACVLLALESGIGALDDEQLSTHMVQHMLLLLLAPLLLLGGRPLILALRVLPPRRRRTLADWLARARPLLGPGPCLAAFASVVILTHLPGFYEATLRHQALHEAEHAAYLLAGLAMWWPILDGDPVPAHRLGGLGRLVYLLLAMLPMALVGAYLNRAPTLVYPAYGPPAHALGISAVVDQQQAGAIMWVVGGVTMVAVGLCSSMLALVAEERRQRARDAHSPSGNPRVDARSGRGNPGVTA